MQTNAETAGVVDGTSGNDKIKGKYKDGDGDRVSGGDDTINAGAGNDFVNAGKGDDTMIYSSGNDTYVGGKGFDTLDLSKYSSDEVVFSKKGKQVIIETPDGTITLEGQIKGKRGTGKVMEEITFSDGSLNEAQIKARALNNDMPGVISGTSGDDVIDSKYKRDPEKEKITDDGNIISAGAGNDVVYAGDGDDTFVYTSGNDTYFTGAGVDTLDLSKYNLSEISVKFTSGVPMSGLGGEEYLKIVTPDGVIRIIDQGARPSSDPDVQTGFESFIFADGTLTEAEFHAYVIASQATDGDDRIVGADNFGAVFDGGAGNDELIGGDLHDTFIYTSGNDIISTGKGFDTLDLSKYNQDEVVFVPLSIFPFSDAVILTPDGMITYNGWGETNPVEAGIDEFIFKDGTVSDDDVRNSVNVVYGTNIDDRIDENYHWTNPFRDPDNGPTEGNDVIRSGGGNDIAYGYGGDDVFVFSGGHDTYIGGEGNDTVVMYDHFAHEVTFSRVDDTDTLLINFIHGME